jgi:Ran GTPase-activating protein (RanGAP) involved in mRNA processing and transport
VEETSFFLDAAPGHIHRTTMGRYLSTKTLILGLWRIELNRKETDKTIRFIEASSDSWNSFILDDCSGYCDVMLATVMATKVQNIHINRNSNNLYALGMGLISAEHLVKLSLSAITTDWTESAAFAIAKGLMHTSSLKELTWSRCKFDHGDSFFILADGLKENKSLRRVEMQKSHLQDEEGAYLISALQGHPCLTALSLEGNYLDRETMNEIGGWMMLKDCRLEKLDLGYQLVHDKDITAIADALMTNCSLRCLDLSGNGLNDDAVLDLWKALRENTTLEYLCLQQNNLSDQAAAGLANNLPHLSLKAVKLYGHPYSKDISELILQALVYNTKLESLSLGAYTSFSVQKQIRHHLHLNRAGRGLCRDSKAPASLWPHFLARTNTFWKNDIETHISVVYGLLREQPGILTQRCTDG